MQMTNTGWKDEANYLLQYCKPKMVVLDLDFTLWPTFFAEHTLPPYICLNEASPSTVLCIDRFTKKPRMLSLFPEVLSTIQWCVDNQLQIGICSRSSNHEFAELILKSLGLWDLFQYPQIYSGRKTIHFRNLRACTQYEYSDFLFFDDDCKNIAICGDIGVNACLVDKTTGFNGLTLLRGLNMLVAQRQCGREVCPWFGRSGKKRRWEERDEADTDHVNADHVGFPSLEDLRPKSSFQDTDCVINV
jgi:magnesium-dependent phosphatase-1